VTSESNTAWLTDLRILRSRHCQWWSGPAIPNVPQALC